MVTDCLTKTSLSIKKSNVMVYCSTDQNKNKQIYFGLHKSTLPFKI